MAETELLQNLLVFSILLSSFAFCQSKSLHDESQLVKNVNENPADAVRLWPWDKNNFKCPSLMGVWPNPDDCSSFYLCVAGISRKTGCPPFTAFDKYHKKCLSILIAICDKTGHTDPPETTKDEGVTEDEGTTPKDSFSCPGMFGTHMHPTDCSKYYACVMFFPTLKTCAEKKLFDGVKGRCRPEKEVNCGSRRKPGEDTDLTTEPIETVPETTPSQEPTPEPTEETPGTPPETDCNENDLDCIIDDTGVTPDWFTCPEDIGSHPHPISQKLFIFCLNWVPSVKKCGQDLVYSNELRTCVDP